MGGLEGQGISSTASVLTSCYVQLIDQLIVIFCVAISRADSHEA